MAAHSPTAGCGLSSLWSLAVLSTPLETCSIFQTSESLCLWELQCSEPHSEVLSISKNSSLGNASSWGWFCLAPCGWGLVVLGEGCFLIKMAERLGIQVRRWALVWYAWSPGLNLWHRKKRKRKKKWGGGGRESGGTPRKLQRQN